MTSILHRTTPITTREEYITLSRKYHPDNGGSTSEQAHINMLYARDYVPPNQIQIGNIHYVYQSHPSTSVYVGKNSVLFTNLEQLPINTLQFAFPDAKVKAEMEKYLPVFVRRDKHFDIVGKPAAQYYLPQYLDQIVGTPHASWIISSLYNLLCYLEYLGLTHNAITVDNICIDPRLHSAHLLGGWRYATPLDSRLHHLPRAALPAPKDKYASHSLDLRMIKNLALLLHGQPTDAGPKTKFMRSPSSGSALKDYKAWMASLGERKFHSLELK